MMFNLAFPVALLFGFCCCDHYLHHLSYTKLPSTIAPQETFKMFGGTAEEAAFDAQNQILYVVGETSRLLHLVDISDPSAPKRVLTHQFTASDGTPRDVAVCGSEVAVAVTSGIRDVYEGHVYFYNTYTSGDQQLQLTSKLTVGFFPDMLTYDNTCTELLVANQGIPGKDINNYFVDPPGSVITIDRLQSVPSERITNFASYNGRSDLRMVTHYIPRSTWPSTHGLPTFSSDVEPEYIAISPDNKNAYVVLQKNNAVAKMSIRTGQITNIYPLPVKTWSGMGMDPSDQDGGVHLRDFPFKSVLQPDVAKVIGSGSHEYLITANEGRPTSFTNSLHGFNWADNSRSDALYRGQKFDSLTINNATFYQYLGLNNKAGHLYVSTIDGYDLFNAKITEPHHFGGRGFSIWRTSDFQLVYDSADTMEQALATFIPKIFNSDCTSNTINTQSPENARDTASDDQGIKLNAMDIITDHGITYMLLGSETVGALYLYTIKTENTTNGHPEPQLEGVFRAGMTDFVWSELYEMDQAGDAGISAIGFIPSSRNPQNRTLAYVIGGYSGSVSLYEIKER